MGRTAEKEAGGTCRPCSFFFWQRNKSYFVPRKGTGVYFCVTKSTKKKFLLPKRGAGDCGRPWTGVALLSDQKRGKSHQRRAPRPPLQTTSHPVELAAESNARQVSAIDGRVKKLLSIAHHIISHTARANKVCRKKRADSTGWVVHAESLATLPAVG